MPDRFNPVELAYLWGLVDADIRKPAAVPNDRWKLDILDRLRMASFNPDLKPIPKEGGGKKKRVSKKKVK